MLEAIQIFLLLSFGLIGIVLLILALIFPVNGFGDWFLLVFIVGSINVFSLADRE